MTPSYVTTMETFTNFFINHGLTKALRKAFKKRGWSNDEMQELITNFQRKHGKKVPMPKIYMDKDDSDSEGLELDDGSRVAQKATKGRGSKCSRDDDNIPEGSGKHRKTDPAPTRGRHLLARKELQKF